MCYSGGGNAGISKTAELGIPHIDLFVHGREYLLYAGGRYLRCHCNIVFLLGT
jgi:hypothetical protein